MHDLSTIIKKTLTATWHTLMPCACALCHAQQDAMVCSDCHQTYFTSVSARCQQCAIPLSANEDSTLCGHCLQHPPAFDASIAACDYGAPRDQLVLALKFGHQLALAPLFASMLRDAILRHDRHRLPDLLCAVPLGQGRLRERGFNQATEIARPLAQHLGVPFAVDALHRLRETTQQSTLKPDARIDNVKNAFMLDEKWLHEIKDAHVAVVDDVMTTGMTLHEIATMLKRFGAAKVTNYVFARTPPHF